MDPIVTASLVSAGSSLLGGLFGGSKSGAAKRAADLEYARQKEFAQNSIQWRAADAQAAGLHPLAALGINPAQYAPQAIGGHDNSAMGNALADAGQSIGRAVGASMSKGDRAKKEILDSLTLEKAKLQNDLLRAQTTNISRPTNPPFPSGSITGDVSHNPDNRTSTRAGDLATTAAAHKPATSEFYNRDGSIVSFPSEDAKNAIEDSIIYETDHFARNRVVPWIARRYTDLYDMMTRKDASYSTNPYY